jgi:hypothetical protein
MASLPSNPAKGKSGGRRVNNSQSIPTRRLEIILKDRDAVLDRLATL